MKSQAFLLAVLIGGVTVAAQAQPAEPSPNDATPAPAPVQEIAAPAPADAPPPPVDVQQPPANPGIEQPGGDATPGPDGMVPAGRTPREVTTPLTVSGPRSQGGRSSVTLVPPKANSGTNGARDLRFNFKNAKLSDVLNYLSDAAGYIIILETQVRGTVDVWSNQPLNKKEAIDVLNKVLNQQGYAVTVEGRFLTVVNKNEAQRRAIPIIVGNNPPDIPRDSQIVTQIIPVRSLNPTQLLRDLAPLLPMDTTITANEAGNSLIMTDTQLNIHRMAEIIKALDGVSSSVNSIKVFALAFADSKAVVAIVKELFPSTDSSGGGRTAMGGGRGGGGMAGGMAAMFGMGGGGGSATSSSQKPSTRVLVVADENSNSVVVSAPDDILELIHDLISSIDISVDDTAEMKVIKLKFADPTETANILTTLFPDDTTSNNNNNRGGGMMGGGMMGGGMMGGGRGGAATAGSTGASDRAKRKGRVSAVPDPRTASVIIRADTSMMPTIVDLVQKMDSDPAKKQRVFVVPLENADPQEVAQILMNQFQSTKNNRSSSSSTTDDPLKTRKNTMTQQQTQSTGIGTSSSSSGSRGN